MSFPHVSVLQAEVMRFFAGRRLSIYVDGTLGAGGHAEAILSAHPEIEIFIGIDQDPDALAIAGSRLKSWSDKVNLVRGNFSDLEKHLARLSIKQVDGILLDLGVSSMQLDQGEKGFSFMKKGPLDMRMDPDNPLSAQEVVNNWTEKDLARVFRDYGEEKQWRLAARAVTEARKKKPILTTMDLADILTPVLSKHRRKGTQKGIHPLTLVFQALRICVNDELGMLERGAPKAIEALAPNGRLAIITFHSLEDRIVKNTFRFAASDKFDTSGIGGVFLDKKPEVALLTRKPVSASEEEVKANPRSRSAKLRVVEKL